MESILEFLAAFYAVYGTVIILLPVKLRQEQNCKQGDEEIFVHNGAVTSIYNRKNKGYRVLSPILMDKIINKVCFFDKK